MGAPAPGGPPLPRTADKLAHVEDRGLRAAHDAEGDAADQEALEAGLAGIGERDDAVVLAGRFIDEVLARTET